MKMEKQQQKYDKTAPVVELTAAQLKFEERCNTEYIKRNGYTNNKSCRQIMMIIVFLLQIVLHSVYVAPYVFEISQEAMTFFFILNYFIMVAVIGHYVFLMLYDPVDSLIIDIDQKQSVQKNSIQETVFCVMCQKLVKKTSYHCYECGRCTEEYDHHSEFLNNCVGLVNYQEYIRLLLFYEIFNGFLILQASWVINKTDNNHGGNIFLILLSSFWFVVTLVMLLFHCYLNCFLKMATFQIFKEWHHRKYEVGDQLQYRQYLSDKLGHRKSIPNQEGDKEEDRMVRKQQISPR